MMSCSLEAVSMVAEKLGYKRGIHTIASMLRS